MNENNMATYFNKKIHSIDPDIIRDIKMLVLAVQSVTTLQSIAAASKRVGAYIDLYEETEAEEKAVADIIDNLNGTQEDKLADECMKSYHGTKDGWENFYQTWLQDLTSAELKQILSL